MAYERRIIHYASDTTTVIQTLSAAGSDSARVTRAWFELLRQGGCGAGEIELRDSFRLRGDIEIGEFIAFEYEAGDRWYFGRVEEVTEESPSVTRVSLYGLFAELNEVFLGGFGGDDGAPRRFANSDYFPNDPDWSWQSWNQVSQPSEIIQLLYDDFIGPNTHVGLGPVESPDPPVGVQSLLFRGEESAAAVLRSLAMVMKSASFGVDAEGFLFVLQKRGTVIGQFREGLDLEKLSRRVDRSLLYNRLLLTGDYVYGIQGAAGFYRYNAHFRLPTSISVHGERRARIFLPWIRRNEDATAFATEFFRVYGEPTTRYEIQTKGQSSLLKPWLGQILLRDRDGATLTIQQFDRIKVTFDHVPIFEITLGPEDLEFPEPPENSRWEVGPPGRGDGQQPPSNSIPPQSTFFLSSSSFSDLASSATYSSSGSSQAGSSGTGGSSYVPPASSSQTSSGQSGSGSLVSSSTNSSGASSNASSAASSGAESSGGASSGASSGGSSGASSGGSGSLVSSSSSGSSSSGSSSSGSSSGSSSCRSQYVPEYDSSNTGGWTASSGSTLYPMVDEATPSDSDYISQFPISSGAYDCILGTYDPGSWPSTLSGWKLRIRSYASDPAGSSLTLDILDGVSEGSIITPRSVTMNASYGTQEWTLSGAEITNIKNASGGIKWKLSHYHGSGFQTVYVSWLEIEAPCA